MSTGAGFKDVSKKRWSLNDAIVLLLALALGSGLFIELAHSHHGEETRDCATCAHKDTHSPSPVPAAVRVEIASDGLSVENPVESRLIESFSGSSILSTGPPIAS